MIRKYKLGKPFETEAVVENIPAETGEMPYFKVKTEEDGIAFSYIMDKQDIVYGLGENLRGINKRGWKYESNCSDDPNHTESKRSLYGAHNFIIVDGKERFGVFIDYPGFIAFDIGYERHDTITISAYSRDMYVYIIEGDSAANIVKQFRRLIGKSYIAPLWAMGYMQSRWGYMCEKDIREVADNFRSNGIPIDSVCLDIDYMERYKDFTVDKERFPDLPKLCSEMKEQNIRLVPIIDAGVKIEDGYDVYEEGKAKGYFCKREDGTDFVAGVWPGKTHFPDMLNADVRKWFGDKYSLLLDAGIEGFWNDMNEPAIFYSEEGLEEAKKRYEELIGKPLDINGFFRLSGNFSISNDPKDYERFYHNVNGEKVVHSKVHNLYGYNMTRAAGEAFRRLSPDKRILMFSRSSYIGMHRYGGIWTGDNQSWWSHLLLNIKMMPSLNMCGFIYTGADLGGFGADTTPDLLLRWLEFGIFTPLMRNHSAAGTRMQEPYRFDLMPQMRDVIKLRYSLLPYLYSEYMNAVLNDEMYFKPLAFDFPEDEMCRRVEDQLMLGKAAMVAPVYEQNARGRYVYLPEEMLFVKFMADGKREYRVMPKGHHYIDAELEETPLFIRKNSFIPFAAPSMSTAELDRDNLEIIGFIEEGQRAEYVLYEDNGFTRDYGNPENYKKIVITNEKGNITVKENGGKKLSVTAVFAK
ncbi:MAG: TIM-barrel domain-containing protein [Ruminiclostridium sp.]